MSHSRRLFYNCGSTVQIFQGLLNIYTASTEDSSKIRNLEAFCFCLTTKAHPSLKSLFILEKNRRIGNSSLLSQKITFHLVPFQLLTARVEN